MPALLTLPTRPDRVVIADSVIAAARRIDACPSLLLLENFLDSTLAEQCYQSLVQQAWPTSTYSVFGRSFSLPRQQTWHADAGIVYSYSNNLLPARPWSSLLTHLRRRIEVTTGIDFNAVLVNYYRSGDDYVGWHSDDEIEMGDSPVIASLSLGATRPFSFRQKALRQEHAPYANLPSESAVLLPAGSLLLMEPEFQTQWEHSVLPCSENNGRINLTFRRVLPP